MSMRRLLIFSLTLLLSLTSKFVFASHYAAGDIYVTYIGAGQDGCSGTTEYKYEITVDVYKACEPGSSFLGTNETLRIWSTNAGYDQSIQMSNPQIDTVDQLCDVYKPVNSCRNAGQAGPYWAFIRHRYTYIWIAPSPQVDWKFSWGQNTCCRNSTILNLANLGVLYIEAGLNNLTKYNNSTPRFLVEPIPFICVNQPAKFLNGPYDANNDSLNIYHHDALQGPGNPCGYNAGYSVTDPIASAANNPFTVNPLTGTATFTPTNQGKFVLAFQCDEYERGTGIPLGYIMRDVQVTVFPCTAPPPGIDSISTSFTIDQATIVKTKTEGYAVYVCPGSNMKFDIHTQTDSANHNIYLEANEAQVSPTATFNPTGNGTNNVTGTFNWTPSTSEYGEHTLIITTKDSTCNANQPIVLKNYTVVLIKVVDGIDAGPDLPICDLNPVPRQLFVKGPLDIKVTWKNTGTGDGTGLNKTDIVNPVATVTSTTIFNVSTTDLTGQCKNSDDIMVYVDTSNTINAFPENPFVLCRPDYVQLDAIVTGKGPISNQSCGIGVIAPGDRIDSVRLYGSPVYGTFVYDTLGATTPTFPNTVSSAKMQFLITKEDLKEAGIRSVTLRDISFEIAKAFADTVEYMNFRIGMKCTNKSSLSKTSGFESGVTTVYSAVGPTLFPNGWKQFTFSNPYSWDTTKNLLVEICYSYNSDIVTSAACISSGPSSPILKFSPTTYNSALFLASPNYLPSYDMCGTLTSTSIVERLARPSFAFNYVDAPALPFTIKWTPGDNLSDSTILQPLSYVNKSVKYMVETYGKSGCIIRDSVDIFVPKHDFRVTPLDTAICFGEVAAPKAYGGFVYKWYEYTEDGKYVLANNTASCFDCPAPILKPLATTTYKIEIGDSVFCFDTLTMRVKVLPLPRTHLLNHDTTIKYGQSIQLLANGAKLYNWTQASTLDNPNISYPVATPTGPTTYVVTGLTADGCRSTDSVRVNIDYRDNLFVPSAFSPNGDGKNDVFRVSNLTVQRVMEFRVYNRWGQEIYFANNNKGWDGTWKNIPQDVGNYTYFIKVAYPDGLIENYKGEVTLVR